MLSIRCCHCPHVMWGRGFELLQKAKAHHGYHSLAGECNKTVAECYGLEEE